MPVDDTLHAGQADAVPRERLKRMQPLEPAGMVLVLAIRPGDRASGSWGYTKWMLPGYPFKASSWVMR